MKKFGKLNPFNEKLICIHIWAERTNVQISKFVLFFICWALQCSFRRKTPKNLRFLAFMFAWNVLLEIGIVAIRSQTHTALYPLIYIMQHHVSFQIVLSIWIYFEVTNCALKIRTCIHLLHNWIENNVFL